MKPITRAILSLLMSIPMLQGAEPPAPPVGPALARLGQALSFPTVSSGRPGPQGQDAFLGFHAFLSQAFPHIHQHLAREVVGRHALLYRWRGRDASLKPILLLAHQDVAAVEDASEAQWTQHPYSGNVHEGHIWGRGARDFKPGLMAILESAEWLLGQGFTPDRDIYFAFGDDEESQGYEGAGNLARVLESRGVSPEFILDEGGGVTQGLTAGVPSQRHVAFVAVTEKGYLSLDLAVEAHGGHSSDSGVSNPILILGEAIRQIEAHPFPASIREPLPSMLRTVGEASTGVMGFVYRNQWLTSGITKQVMAGKPTSEPLVRNTVTVTRFESGIQDNVVPGRAHAIVNIRLLPGWTIPQAVAHMDRAIRDPRVKVSIRGRASEAPPVAPTDTAAYRLLASTIQSVFPGALVAPYLTTGATDSRHYAALTTCIYRFAPSVNTRTFSGNAHGLDERLPVDNYRQYLAFYTLLIANAGTADSGSTAPPPRP